MGDCGIYAIKNIVNGKRYIGSAKNISRRWSTHKLLLNKGMHYNSHLQSTWNKYGENNFEFYILLKCKKDELIENEQVYMDEHHPEYNICPKAGAGPGSHSGQASIETRAKMSASRKGKKFGHWSDASKAKLSALRKGRPGHPHTDEEKAKISAANKRRIISDETRKKLGEAGKRHKKSHGQSEETRAKISAKKMGIKMRPFTEEHKEKIRAALIGRKLTPEQLQHYRSARKATMEKQKIV